MSFQETSLWKNAFEGKKGSEKEKADKLRLAFLDFREKAAHLANEIPRHLPGLTVHDVTHLDALWEIACLIAGPDITLTPTEAFVLGGAFLTHDLAMSVAAYSESFRDIENTDGWKDLIHKYLTQRFSRQPTETELSSPDRDIIEKAQQEMLRELHAVQAEKLTTQKWSHERLAYDQFLIDNTELRLDFGTLIGRLAHSHWWPIEKIGQEFTYKIGAPGHFPTSWDIDPLKLACLLRVADASHIDDRRAPTFLFAIRKPQGLSLDHWNFQNLLNRPVLDNDQLLYTSKRPFTLGESTSWWICFDTLVMINSELRRANSLLAEKKAPRFKVRGVLGTENADYLRKFVRVEGWEPVDTRIRVSDVAKLARTLGGKQLYGEDELVPLRELIQNASDAVRARRTFESRSENWGEITVRLGEDDNNKWLEVEDDGIGMSPQVLKGPFLDFGTSYWGSGLMMNEWPGLVSKGFEATGRFGIGFFSVFMWADKVEIKSRRCTESKRETFILFFDNGLDSRPILRRANDNEQLREGGTCIKLFLNENFKESERTRIKTSESRGHLYARLCPTLDVNLTLIDCNKERESLISSNDWLTINSDQIQKRLKSDFFPSIFSDLFSEVNYGDKRINSLLDQTLGNLYDDFGSAVGRITLQDGPQHCCITVGGFNTGTIKGVFGFLKGGPVTAKRDVAKTLFTASDLNNWAQDQKLLFGKVADKTPLEELTIASKLISLIEDPGELSFAITDEGPKNLTSIKEWIKNRKTILLIESGYLTPAFELWKTKKWIKRDNFRSALSKFGYSMEQEYDIGDHERHLYRSRRKNNKEAAYKFVKTAMHDIPYKNILLFSPADVTDFSTGLKSKSSYETFKLQHLDKKKAFTLTPTSFYIVTLASEVWKIDLDVLIEHLARDAAITEIGQFYPFNEGRIGAKDELLPYGILTNPT